jgi:hypothetical protein
MRPVLIVFSAITLFAACGSDAAPTAGNPQQQPPTKIELPPITLTKATEVLTAAEVAGVFPGATFKVTEERNDPPAGYSAISGCRFVEQDGDELRRRNVVITVRSHGVEADAASFMKSSLELAQEADGKVTLVPELGEHAYVVIRAAS